MGFPTAALTLLQSSPPAATGIVLNPSHTLALPCSKPFQSSPLTQHQGQSAHLSVKGPRDLFPSSLPSTLLSVILQLHRIVAGS